MAITFSSGFRIIVAAPTMRSFLSAAGKTTYDATTVGNFFSCSLSDYNAVFSGYADAQKIGNTDSEFSTVSGASYTATCASVLPQANSTLLANTYLVGFACRMLTNSNYTITPLSSTTYKGTYTAISNSPTLVGTTTSNFYFLRKDPPILPSITYVGHVASNGFFDQATVSYTNAGFDCTAPYSTWSNRNGPMPPFQMFTTITKPY